MREPVVQEVVINGITYVPNTNLYGCDGCDINGNCTVSNEFGQISLCDIFGGYGLKEK